MKVTAEAVTPEQVAFFEVNGYLRYGPVIGSTEVNELRRGLDRIIELELSGGDDGAPEFKFGHDRERNVQRDARAITQFVNMWKRDPAYERLIHHPVITAVARGLLRTPEVRLWHDQVISKPPGDNGHFRFHQDFYFWPLDEPRIVSCWLALDEATVENGCMHVMPRSHRDERFGLEAQAREAEIVAAGGTTERQKREKEPASAGMPVELPAGACMFHHCLNFHATPENRTDRQRRAFVMIFMAQGVRYRHSRSPGHPLIPTIEVADGEPLTGTWFPVA